MLGTNFQAVQGSVRESQTKVVGQNHSQPIKLLMISLSWGCALPPDLSLYLLQEPILGSVALPACSALTHSYLFTKLFSFSHMHCAHLQHCSGLWGVV